MSQSTPHRPSSGKQKSGDDLTNTLPTTQDKLKAFMSEELQDATWQLDATHLARALSAKSRKDNAPPLSIVSTDSVDHYDIAIDKMGPELENAIKFFKPAKVISSTSETAHYDSLAAFLNSCLTACRTAAKSCSGHYYSALNFATWGRPTKDGVRDAHPLKPDCVGAQNLPNKPSELWWRPQFGHRSSTVEIPVEVKDSWPELVSQAATYARSLINAVPLRQFSLVIGYNHQSRELRFLVFHAGGLTSSPPLKPDKSKDQPAILRLFLSLLTWNSPGDAGFPEWCNDVDMYIQRSRDDRQGVEMRITQVYYDCLGVRGRGSKIVRLAPIPPPQPLSPPPPSFSSPPSPHVQTFRRSLRKPKQRTKEHIPLKKPHKAASTQYGQADGIMGSAKNQEEESSELSRAPIGLYQGSNTARFVHQRLDYFSKSIETDAGDVVSKIAWVGCLYAPVESRMFETCSGMFGVMPFYHSSIVHHKENLPITNHLFLVDAKFWDAYKLATGIANDHVPDLRVLVRHLSQHAGEPLSSVSEPQQLFVAIAHAALGYRNFIERGFHHRDISMGNVLWSKVAKETKSVFETLGSDLTETRARLREQLGQSRVGVLCHGFVIDGDLAVDLGNYFAEDLNGIRTRSGTNEYMSNPLLDAAALDKRYLQSPVDDLLSFYYVTQWAAANNNRDFPDSAMVSDELKLLRKRLASSSSDRELATSTMTKRPLDPELYGTFAAECQPILQEWDNHLMILMGDWERKLKTIDPDVADQYAVYYPLFRESTDRGVFELLRLVQARFGESLKGVS